MGDRFGKAIDIGGGRYGDQHFDVHPGNYLRQRSFHLKVSRMQSKLLQNKVTINPNVLIYKKNIYIQIEVPQT